MGDVIEGLKKSYIIISMKIWKKWGSASGPRGTAFGFGIKRLIRELCRAGDNSTENPTVQL